VGKGNKERIVLINPETAERIFEHYRKKYQLESIDKIMEFSNSQSLLFTTNGKQISEWYVWEIIHTGSKKILGREIRTHELRHARATELEKMGVPIIDIKYYLGHSSVATTEIYLHKAERESIENIKDILGGKQMA
jgi:site-specific recombinase XerD